MRSSSFGSFSSVSASPRSSSVIDTSAFFGSSALRICSACSGNVKRLQDIDPPEYRLRVGDYRVRFELEKEIMRVLRVRNRREAYR